MGNWQLLLALLVLHLCHRSLSETKILRVVKISQPDASRMEKYALKNENTANEELIINGTLYQTFYSTDSPSSYRLETFYVADKNGYRAKYTLILLPPIEPLGLTPNTLKTITG